MAAMAKILVDFQMPGTELQNRLFANESRD
jgi:hypothetical protein